MLKYFEFIFEESAILQVYSRLVLRIYILICKHFVRGLNGEIDSTAKSSIISFPFFSSFFWIIENQLTWQNLLIIISMCIIWSVLCKQINSHMYVYICGNFMLLYCLDAASVQSKHSSRMKSWNISNDYMQCLEFVFNPTVYTFLRFLNCHQNFA